MRHINIPVFIPHLGCPNQCVFCNQRVISGTKKFDELQPRNEIEEILKTIRLDDECEIAFFGGSFTGIDMKLMVKLLDMAQNYVDSGRVKAIRMSTRPDYINSGIIEVLKNYTISCVELGIQSMNDRVLLRLKRGHSANDTLNAVKLLKESGFDFVGQMMIGLPGATPEDEIWCAEKICELGACGARIYPTLVLRSTELEEMTERGEYKPLTLEEAIKRSASTLKIFYKNKVPCIRIGLCDSKNLHSEKNFVDGPNSPSIGEMIKSELFYDLICEKLVIIINRFVDNKLKLFIRCPKKTVSQIVGHKRKNIIRLKREYGFNDIKVIEDASLGQYELKLETEEV